MPLDFLASEKKNDICEKSAFFSLNESAHRALLESSIPRSKFRTIHKFADYYADTTILLGEIQPLLLEIDTLATAGKIVSSDFNGLVDFLNSAWRDKLNIYIFAD